MMMFVINNILTILHCGERKFVSPLQNKDQRVGSFEDVDFRYMS